MMREVSVVACGQAGIQLGDAVWRSHCAEHGVLADGKNPDTSDDGSFRSIFEETNGGLLNGKMKIVGIILEEDIILLVKKLLIK